MGYTEVLKSIMHKNENVVALTAEARVALGDIPELYPDRFCDVGIAEQNLIGLASGISALGKIAFAHAPICGFTTMRAFDHIRSTAAMQGRNVKIPGFLPGFSVGFQGPTHVGLEDISIMRSIAGMTVLSTASHEELKEVMEYAVETDGTVYFRAESDLPQKIDYCEPTNSIDQPRVVCKGKKGLVISTGGMVARVQKAINSDMDLALVNLSLLKPAPVDALHCLLEKYDKVAAVEEHFITGGLGSIVAEMIADHGLGSQLCRIGVPDKFPDRYTEHETNLAYIGMDVKGIKQKLKEFFK